MRSRQLPSPLRDKIGQRTAVMAADGCIPSCDSLGRAYYLESSPLCAGVLSSEHDMKQRPARPLCAGVKKASLQFVQIDDDFPSRRAC
jgi:hypothetical protein